ncbi:MAG: flagellar biosynthesis protein FlhB [Angelakisella sp.]
MAGEKTEQATPKRKQDERKKGNIFQSQEVVIVASLFIMFTALKMLSPMIAQAITTALSRFWQLGETINTISLETGRQLFIQSMIAYGICTLPLMGISCLVAVVVTFAQTRGLITTKSMGFKFSRLNPLSGLKKLFSLRGLVELLKSLVKISVLTYIIYTNLQTVLPVLPKLFDVTPMQATVYLGDIISSLINATAAVFVFLAVADYVYQWWEYEKNLRMSKDEIKEEYKQTEGDPAVKGKIKDKQRQMAMSRMMQGVPSADVVVRNPTHFAVAIKYDPDNGRAPRVIAKGADRIALRIVEVAEQAGVTVSENVSLARGLYAAVEIGMEIPEQFYQPVAEVLAFVYNIKKQKPPAAKQQRTNE